MPQVVLRKVDGAEILRRVEQHGVTLACGAPAVWSAVLDAAASWDGPIPGRDRMRIVVAGAPPPTRVIARVEEELGWEFTQIYGLTETTPLVTSNRTRAEWDGESALERARLLSRAGAPAIGTEVKISDSGEVLVRSNTVLDGYWEQPDVTAAALEGGWFHTGDGGTFEDGYLTISDRRKDVIITGGENVSSIEVEDAIFSHPAVAEVAVIGVPDERWGETIKALIVSPKARPSRRRRSSPGARSGWPATRRRRRSRSATTSRAPRPGRCRSSSSASRTGRIANGRSTDARMNRMAERRDPDEPRFAGPPTSMRTAPPLPPWSTETPASWPPGYGEAAPAPVHLPTSPPPPFPPPGVPPASAPGAQPGASELEPVVDYGPEVQLPVADRDGLVLSRVGSAVAAAGGLLAGLGSLFTWVTLRLVATANDVQGFNAQPTITYNGLSLLEGRIILVLGILAIGLSAAAVPSTAHRLLPLALAVTGGVAVIVMAFAAIGHPVELATLFRSYRTIDAVQVNLPNGVGTWMAVIGALLILAGGLLALMRGRDVAEVPAAPVQQEEGRA